MNRCALPSRFKAIAGVAALAGVFFASLLMTTGLTLAAGGSGGEDAGDEKTGNVIFIHPDGTGPNHWAAARTYWYGPDAISPWDRLPYVAMYRGHMSDQLGATSNGGATTHAFGYKVQGPDSYGTDRGRKIVALSGYPGSILREAANAGHPVGVVNDGDINGEPGTGAFLAETERRGQPVDHALQILGGRPGFDGGTPDDITDGEPDPQVVLGGGERFFLPQGTPQCEQAPTLEEPRLDCFVHRHPAEFGAEPAREDGRNLLKEAAADGWLVLRTRAEFEALVKRVKAAEPGGRYWAPKVLGLFAAEDLFNDAPEEKLQNPSRVPTAGGLVRGEGDPLPEEGRVFGADKIGPLVLWGAKHGDPRSPFSFDPPTGAEMTELALQILARRAEELDKPFAAVVELESTDNMPNDNNAIGALRALQRANDTIAVARDFLASDGAFAEEGDPQTMIITAADSDASGLQLLPLRHVEAESPSNPLRCEGVDPQVPEVCVEPGEPPVVTETTVNPRYGSAEVNVHVDGIAGWGTRAFIAERDALSSRRNQETEAFRDHVDPEHRGSGGGAVSAAKLPFAIVWTSLADVAGGVASRAEGLNAELLVGAEPLAPGEPPLSARFDNTDVYRMMYLTLFGERLPSAIGKTAPTR